MAFCYNLWVTLVQVFMAGNLTYFQDRLPALAGIAERLGQHIEDEYLAGAWRNGLSYNLVWHNNEGLHWKRPPGYFAPSWSWAHCHVDEGFHIIECKVQLVNSLAKYGAVKSGYITVRARMLSARYINRQDRPIPSTRLLIVDGIGIDPVEITESGMIGDAELNGLPEGEIALPILCGSLPSIQHRR
ncbi:hypothetical protein BJ170DRAFT_736230 [Xylariales sp. AK1849]|nr:hypothetical protein BJ170DRAFT_736230 [Xylariales sp. AK1849]